MKPTSNISRRRRSALSDGGADYTAKREELVRIAARLFRERGYTSTRLVDIANAAGLDRATVYYYVGSKEELFRESVEGILDANLAQAESVSADKSLAANERIRQIVTQMIASYEQNFPQMYVYIQEQMHQVAHEETTWAQEIVRKTKRFETIVKNLIKEGIERGEFRDDLPVRLAANALFGMINWMHRWHVPGRALSAGDIASAFSQIFCDGMLVRKS
ncbi:MAG TPA: TetR/AcrR family transcriptional regulator [Methylibium sp.]|nr:TetR/AcrR family transcriptional regulator [Methylibium sp.]